MNRKPCTWKCILHNLTGDYIKFEDVSRFTYLGSAVNNDTEMLTDIRSITVAANHVCVAHKKLFRSKFLPRNVYMRI